jgi:hypothetical protein
MPSKTCHLFGKSYDRQHKHEDKVFVLEFLLPRSMGLLGVARANTAVGVSPETFLLLLQQRAIGRSHFGW